MSCCMSILMFGSIGQIFFLSITICESVPFMLSIDSIERRVAEKYFSDISGSFVFLPMKGDMASCFQRHKKRFGVSLNTETPK